MQDSTEHNRPRTASRKFRWVWAALVALLIIYIFSAWRVGPVSNFGIEGDDGVYFAAAKALATGQGYVMLGFPVRLAATRYPEFYPLLLAGIWKLDPHFPGNVNWAVALTLAFGCMALIFAFLLLRRWPDLGDWDALGVVALCAFSAYFLDLGASVLSDVPFMALMLGAIWLAERGLSSDDGEPIDRTSSGQKNSGRSPGMREPRTPVPLMMLGAGALAALCIGFRTVGATTVAGIGIVLLLRREFRKFTWFSVAAVPIAVAMVWPQLVALTHPAAMPPGINQGGTGWTQTLCYYTSYACAWRMNINGPASVWNVVIGNLPRVIQEPWLYLVYPLGISRTVWSLFLWGGLSIAAWVGVVQYSTRSGWQALTVTFLLYLAVVVPWPYSPDRFLVPFAPLFVGGIWLAGRNLARSISDYLRKNHATAERAIAGLIALAGLGVGGTITTNYCYSVPSHVRGEAKQRAKELAIQRGAFQWIRSHVAPGDSIVSFQGELLYLYAGRRTVMPIAPSTQSFYDHNHKLAEQEIAHLPDVARHIRASYWLTINGESLLATRFSEELLKQEEERLLANEPVVYQAAGGTIRLYDVRCLTGATKAGCDGKSGVRQAIDSRSSE